MNVSNGNHKVLSLGFKEMADGTTEDFLSSPTEVLCEKVIVLSPVDASELDKEKNFVA